MNRSQVRLRLRPQLVIVLALEHLATHAGNSLHSARALHSCILGACRPSYRANSMDAEDGGACTSATQG